MPIEGVQKVCRQVGGKPGLFAHHLGQGVQRCADQFAAKRRGATPLHTTPILLGGCKVVCRLSARVKVVPDFREQKREGVQKVLHRNKRKPTQKLTLGIIRSRPLMSFRQTLRL